MQTAMVEGDVDEAYVHRLPKCLDDKDPIYGRRMFYWRNVRDRAEKLFEPSRGGSYEVFNARPLSIAITRYCIYNVIFLQTLRGACWNRLTEASQRVVEQKTQERLQIWRSSAGRQGEWYESRNPGATGSSKTATDALEALQLADPSRPGALESAIADLLRNRESSSENTTSPLGLVN
jgi:hypothetical protein